MVNHIAKLISPCFYQQKSIVDGKLDEWAL